MRTFFSALAGVVATFLLCTSTAEAQWCQDINGAYWCGDPDSCELCSSEGWSCDTPCSGFGGSSTCGQYAGNPANDLDGDGVLNTSDNCLCTSNAGQADCDGDNLGTVCDPENASYQQVSNQRCWIDRDAHATHYDLEDYWERRYLDFSSCGAPDKYVRYKNNEATCFGFPTPPPVFTCCMNLIVNDSWWCTRVDQNFCH
ncbi:MAG TPA: hypothetical protein VJG13_16390 [Thermoanaerobaculia bacterium]|nr:hypothetical protein [Thermoanaerobaculia bacterium]